MGRRAAAIAGFTEWKPAREWPRPMFALEAMAQLASEVLADAGVDKAEVDGLVVAGIAESPVFAPSAAAEYLGLRCNFNEIVDLGGATPAAMTWRAAAAIEVGACDTVLVLCPGVPAPPPPDPAAAKARARMPLYMGGDAWGSAQALYEIPAGLVAATPSYAMAAQRYMAVHGLREETLAKIAVHQRCNAQANPDAIFHGTPITIDDVMRSRKVADPLKLLEVVMPCAGGGALLVTRADRAQRGPHRPVFVSGFGEHLTHKSIACMPDLLDPPTRVAAGRAFAMAGARRDAIDLACIYDCYTIAVLLTIEASGFCAPGQGGRFVEEHDLRYDGDWPLNTHGGQLSFGQPGLAGGLSHVIESVRQIQGRAGARQIARCNLAYCNGNGGMMSEQVALVLEGA
ncbi:MAG: thiolase family protein [Gammaproteobacteria bacterium]